MSSYSNPGGVLRVYDTKESCEIGLTELRRGGVSMQLDCVDINSVIVVAHQRSEKGK